MDNSVVYNYQSLDQALLPDPDGPLKPGQFVPDAAFGTFKIVDRQTVSVTRAASATIGQTIVAHNLGYIPVILAFFINTIATTGEVDQLFALPYYEFKPSNGTLNTSVAVGAQKTALNFTIFTPVSGDGYASGETKKIQYFLLQDQAKSA